MSVGGIDFANVTKMELIDALVAEENRDEGVRFARGMMEDRIKLIDRAEAAESKCAELTEKVKSLQAQVDALADLIAVKDEALRTAIKIAATQVGLEEEECIGGWFKEARKALSQTHPSSEVARAKDRVVEAAKMASPCKDYEYNYDNHPDLDLALAALAECERNEANG